MTYPLINGGLINGAESSSAYTDTRGIGPARFGAHLAVAHLSASALVPARFGMPRVKEGTDLVAEAGSLQSARLGPIVAASGSLPPDAALQVSGLRPVRFGTPQAKLKSVAGPVAGLSPVKFGDCHGVARQLAAGLGSVRLGSPAAGAAAAVASIRPARLGVPHAVCVVAPAPLQAGRYGISSIHIGQLSAQVSGLQSAGFGVPWVGALALRARPLASVQLGRPVADRGNAC